MNTRPKAAEAITRFDILVFIDEFIKEKRIPPTYRQIQAGLEIASLNTVSFHLNRLEFDGYIEREFKLARSIRVLMRPVPERVADQ